MIVYTAEDFAQATLATKGRFGVAHRVEPYLTHQWRAYGEGHGWFSDEEMAADGWVPVMEDAAHDRIMTLLNTKNTLERTVYELRRDLAVARKGREPWADLADVLLTESVVFDNEDASIAARALHNAGVRVTGGDDGE